jgi:hypothetical protein
MPSAGMLRRVSLVITDLSEEHSASVIRVTVGELGKNLRSRNVPSSAILDTLMMETLRSSKACVLTTATRSPILVTLMMEALHSSKTSVLTIAAGRNIQEVGILHSHRHENLKTYILADCLENVGTVTSHSRRSLTG